MSAVADEFVLAHPTGHTDMGTAAAIVGGPLLFLIGNWLFKWAVLERIPVSPLVAIAVIVSLMAVAALLPPVGLMAVAAVVLVASAAWEWRSPRAVS